SSGRPQSNRKSSRPSSPPLQRQLAPLKTEPSTPPSSYYQTDITTPQHHLNTPLARPQAILQSQSLPHDLNLLPQGSAFMTPQFTQIPYAIHPTRPYSGFHSQPGTPYFTPTGFQNTPQYQQSPNMDFTRQSQL